VWVGDSDHNWQVFSHTRATIVAPTLATTADPMRRVGHTSAQVAMIYQHSDEQRDIEIAVGMLDLAEQGFNWIVT